MKIKIGSWTISFNGFKNQLYVRLGNKYYGYGYKLDTPYEKPKKD